MYNILRKRINAILGVVLTAVITLLGIASCKSIIIGRQPCLYGGPPEAYRNIDSEQNDSTKANANMPTKTEEQQE